MVVPRPPRIGFARVNEQVKSSIAEWIAGEFKANIDRLLVSVPVPVLVPVLRGRL